MSELRPHSRELLAAARLERTPSRADRERVFRALTAGAALTGAASSAAAAPSLFAKLATGVAKWWLLGGLGAALVGGSYLARHHDSSVAPVRAAATPAPPGLASPSPGPVSVSEPSAPASSVEASSVPASPVIVHAAPSPSPHSTLEQELQQLHLAQAAYRDGQAQRALGLISEHERRFPQSQLGGERAVLKVLSLCQVGKTSQARKLADQLRSTGRSSAALTGLETSCAATAK